MARAAGTPAFRMVANWAHMTARFFCLAFGFVMSMDSRFCLAHGDHALDDTALLARAFHGLDLVERLDHAVDLLAGGRYPGVSEGWHQRTLFLT